MNLPKGISKRPDGLYEARIMYHGIRHSLYGHDVDKLLDDLDELKYQLKHKAYEEDSKLTFADISALYIEKKKFDEARKSTIESYNQALDLHILPTLGKYRIADISKEQIRSFISGLTSYADGTKSIIWTVLKGVFDFAYYEGYTTKNGISGIALPKAKKQNRKTRLETKAKCFTSDQYRIVMNEADKLVTRDLIKFAAYTGLRKGELQGVKYKDIDYTNKVIHVQRSIDKNGNEEEVKTEAGNRLVPLSDEAMKIVRGLKIISAKGYVFCDRNGNAYTTNYLSSEIRKLNNLCKAVDKSFPQFSIHTFRHNFATKCANNGMIPKVLMGIMGHSSIAMTMDYYSHQEMESAITELKKVEGAF